MKTTNVGDKMIKYKKKKGKMLENNVQEILRNYFNVDEKIIRRNVSSGTQDGENGDVNIVDTNIETIFPYVIECKNQEIWDIRDIIGDNVNKKSSPFIKYWDQIEKEVKYYNSKYNLKKYGLLVFSKQHYPIYQMVKYNKLQIKYINNLFDIPHIITNINNTKYVIMEFNNFLNLVQNEVVKDTIEK